MADQPLISCDMNAGAFRVTGQFDGGWCFGTVLVPVDAGDGLLLGEQLLSQGLLGTLLLRKLLHTGPHVADHLPLQALDRATAVPDCGATY